MIPPLGLVGLSIASLAATSPPVDSTQDEPRRDDSAVVWTVEKLELHASAIRADIEEICGRPFKDFVDVRLATPEEFTRYYRNRIDSLSTPERLATDETVAKLLGMIPGDMDLEAITLRVLEEQVGGFYDPGTSTFYIVDSVSEGFARVIMAHELTHALDDQYHDFDATDSELAGNSDAMLAHHAVIEGSGMALMSMWALRNRDTLDVQDLLQGQSAIPTDAVEDAPPFVWKPLMAIYAQGQTFLQRQSRMSLLAGPPRIADIERAFTDRPRSMEQVLHPVKYWKDDRVDEPRRLRCEAEALPEGWRIAREDTLGELLLSILTTPIEERGGMEVSLLGFLGMEFTNEAASGWGGDRFLLLERDGGYVIRLVTLWDSIKDAQEFRAALDGLQADIVASMGRIEGAEEGELGFRIDSGAEEDEVIVTAWAGVSEETAESVTSALVFEEIGS